MKKKLLFVLCGFVFTSLGVNAQVTFFDDFESYEVGDNIAATSDDWDTWSGSDTEDAPITDEQAFSGTKSLLIAGVPAGGPTDVILPFGDTYTDGLFTFSMMMYVPEGSATYQNIQAIDPPGSTWAMQMYFNSDGSLLVDQGVSGGFSFSGLYPQDEWFPFVVEVNLSTNIWQLFVGDKLLGFFENANNSVASLDLYPYAPDGETTPVAYIDDIRFDWTEYDVPSLDVAIVPTVLKDVYLTSDEFELNTNIKNVGLEEVNSVTVNYSVGDQSYSETLEDLNLGFLDQFNFEPANELLLAGGINELTVEVINPNGIVDDIEINNRQDLSLFAYAPREHKKVLVEEFTGTWCQFCPRGAVFMDRLMEEYGQYMVPVALHGGGPDPMEIVDILPPESNTLNYVDALGQSVGNTGFPNATTDRQTLDDPSRLVNMTLPQLENAPAAWLEIGGEWNLENGNLRVDVTANDIDGLLTTDHRLAVVITEDEVTGTDSGYAQSNAFAGGDQEMGGYENLPSLVPASQMVYEFVARAYLGELNGAPGSITSTTDPNTFSFVFNLPEEWNKDNLFVNAILIDPSGEVSNALDAAFWDAITPTSDEVTGIDDLNTTLEASVYPNPFSNNANISLTNNGDTNVEVIVYNVQGIEVSRRVYQSPQGQVTLPMNASNLANGNYIVEIITAEGVARKHISLQR